MADGIIPDAALALLQRREPWVWLNPELATEPDDVPAVTAQVMQARDRFSRAEGLIRKLFELPHTGRSPIYSPLMPAADLIAVPSGSCFVKADHALPIAGSIKARGGFHEVIAYAERLALEHGLIEPHQDLLALTSPEVRSLFARHSVMVGSTGNLGLSIGLCSVALGFKAVVHMSEDAKEWKKQRLRDLGVEVVEHSGDYGEAVAKGRALAADDPLAHFVDDEMSVDLFSGYACASYELASQLDEAGVRVDEDHPLFVYLPCGVGGAPGGITYGLKLIYGAAVHCFFAEPTESPCMLVQLLSGADRSVSVYDVGLTNRTELDGLAVGAASLFVSPLMRERVSGIYTVTDAEAYDLLRRAHQAGIDVEPSAAIAFAGPGRLAADSAIVPDPQHNATHVSWTTGGSLVPADQFRVYLSHQETA
ncbi:MAG: D-serine ammonia-lyase [Shinella sp.]|nr:MAG: D-serine ammonia-lyase [Shinella sp.]